MTPEEQQMLMAQQQQQPQYPGFFATSLLSGGMAGQPGTAFQQAQMGSVQSSNIFANSAVGLATNLPSMALASSSAVAMIAGPILRGSGQTFATQQIGKAMTVLDPGMWVWNAASRGSQAAIQFAGGGNMTFGNAVMGGRLGLAGAGALGGIAAGIPPALAAIAATEAVKTVARSVWQGHQQNMMGQVVMSQMGQSFAPGMSQRETLGFGATVGRDMQDLSRVMRVSMDEVVGITQSLKDNRFFDTTSTVREFQSKLRAGLKTIKEIAFATQSSIEESLQTFNELRQQGFYSNMDIKTQAVARRAREAATGITQDEQSVIGQMGAQAARAYGLRGRFGAELFNRNVMNVAEGLRSGLFSEEYILEHGGKEAVGMQLAQQQLGFLGSSRGRAVIAAMMGSGRSPDTNKLMGLVSGGMTLESLVERAAGSGLGTLMAAGRRDAKENFAPYANMAMVSIASAQAKQIYGEVDPTKIRTMMGTFGIGWEESDLVMRTAFADAQRMQNEAVQQQRLATEDLWQRYDDASSFSRRAKRFMRVNFGNPLNQVGSDLSQGAQQLGRGLDRALWGTPRRYVGGGDADRELALAYMDRMGVEAGSFGAEFNQVPEARYGLLGPLSASQLMKEYIPSSARRQNFRTSAAGMFGSWAWSGSAASEGQTLLMGWSGHDTFSVDSGTYESLQGAASQDFAFTPEQLASLRNQIREGGLRGDVNLTGLGLAMSSQGTAVERTAYALGRRMNVIPSNATMEDYVSGRLKGLETSQKRMTFQTSLSRELQKSDDEGVRSMLSDTTGFTGVMGSYDSLRSEFETGISGFVREFGEAGSGSFLNMIFGLGATPGTNNTDLVEKLTTQEDARRAYRNMMNVLTKPGATESDLETAQEELADALGGRDSAAFRAVQPTLRRARSDPKFKERLTENWKNNTGLLFERRGYGEMLLSNIREVRSSLQGKNLDADGRLSDSMRSALGGLRSMSESTTGEEFDRKLNAIYAETLEDGVVKPDEATLLDEMLGGMRGTGLKAVYQDLSATGKGAAEKHKAVLDALRFKSEDDKKKLLENLSSSDPNVRAGAIVDAITKGSGGMIIKGSKGKGATSLEGVTAEYIDSNRKFVAVVSQFLSSMGSVLGDATLQKIMADLEDGKGGDG